MTPCTRSAGWLGWLALASVLLVGCAIDDLTDGAADAGPGMKMKADAPAGAPPDGGVKASDARPPKTPDASTCTTAYASAVLADSPAAYYRMNESSGTVMADATANHLDGSYGLGVLLGQSGLIPSSSDLAPRFPGLLYTAADTASVAPGPKLKAASNLSVELVFEEDIVNPGNVGDGYIDVASYDWVVQITPTNHLEFYLETANLDVQGVVTTAPLVPKAVYHVAATYDGSTARLYLNGDLAGSEAATGAVSYGSASGAAGLSIGASSGAASRAVLQGKIADVAVYATTLSATQVAAHMEAGGKGGEAHCQPGHADAGGDAGSGGKSDAAAMPPADGSTSSAFAPGFPRLASALISTASGATDLGYDATYVQWASKLNANIYGGWAGFGSEIYGGSREAFVSAVHAQSTTGTKMFQYYITDNNYEYWPVDAATVNGSILYQDGTGGACEQNFYNASWCNTNQTLYLPANAGGLHLEGAFATDLIATIHGSTVDAEPSLDGTFHDNLILTPTSPGDYARNGTVEQTGDPTAGQWLRDGFAEGFDYLHAHSSLITIGNISGWGIATGSSGDTGMDATGLVGLVQGGFMEGTFGYNWSIETWSGFSATVTHYQFCMANTGAPRVVMVHHSNLQANGSDPTAFDSSGNPTSYGPPYQAMRYGLAFTLMDDGYYATSQSSAYANTQQNWFDEYAVDPTTGVALAFPGVDSGLGYLGQPTDPAWPAASNGVYSRHFKNTVTGKTWLVLLNPKGNGQKTVALGQSFTKLTGTQAPTVNDGSSVTSIVLQDRDGLILMGP